MAAPMPIPSASRLLLSRILLVILSTFSMALAAEETCRTELSQLAAGLPADMPPGSFAAQLLAGAVELVEPALPPWRWNARVPLAEHEAGFGAVKYLVERDLVPDEWRAGELTGEVWHAMLAGFLDWYGLPPPEPAVTAEFPAADSLVRQRVLEDLGAVLQLISAAVRPVAVIASDSAEDVAFVGVIWNWTVYPRLLVWRGEGLSLADGPAGVLPFVSNCAVQVERFALAPVETAWQLFMGAGEATMFVLESEPARKSWPLLVEQPDVLEFLAFDAAPVRGLTVYAAAFDGQELGFGAILRLVTQVRTNVAPTAIMSFLSTPAR
jgi:hypothetical protein